jgi:fatty-acyl-CoA synthase
MPEAIAQKLFDVCGVRYMEGYGMTETISQTHINPPQNAKKQCLGIPTFDTESLIIDPDTFKPLDPGEQGEIVVRGPQLLTGYWKKQKDFNDSWAVVDGKPFFRTGDLGSTDDDGYFYISDRLKRMINASGYKVWPAEVEALMYRHPAIQEACVIAARDEKRGRPSRRSSCCARAMPPPKQRSPPGAISTWQRTRRPASCSSSTRCRSRARAR